MTTFEDVTTAVEGYGADQFTAGASSRDEELAGLTDQVTLRTAERDAALKRVAELEQAEPVTRLPFGIGVNEKPMSSKLPLAYTAAALEKEAGAKFAYMREYFTYPTTGVHDAAIAWAMKVLGAGRVPVMSFKLPKVAGKYDWEGAGNGKYDAVIDGTNDAMQDLVRSTRDAGFKNARILEAESHEFDNDGLSLAAFNAMTEHLIPIVRRPGDIEFWLDFTGYAQIFQTPTFSLDAVYQDGIDGYAMDPYQSTFQQTANAKKATFTDLPAAYLEPWAKWCDGKGIQKGVWETGFTALAQASTKLEAKVWIDHNASAAADLGYTCWIYWNNNNPDSGNDWRIQDVAPANTRAQMVAALKKFAWTA